MGNEAEEKVDVVVEDDSQVSQLLDLVMVALKDEDDDSLVTLLADCRPGEIAALLEALPLTLRRRLWALIPSESMSGEILSALREEVRNTIIDKMDHDDVVAAAESMPDAELAQVIEELSEALSESVLKALDEDHRQRLETIMAFEEGTAGRLMNSDVISVRKDVTLAVVLRYLRRLKSLPSHTDNLMVTDDEGLYLGTLSIADAVTGNPDAMVEDVMLNQGGCVRGNADENDVARLFERRDLISLAVTDDNGKLLGRITVDDVLYLIRAQADRALLAQAGLDEDDDLFAPVFPSAKRRGLWLGINLATVFLAAGVIGLFQEVLAKVVALAVLMPIVASMGGIAGSQTLTLTIRGMALGQVTSSNLRWLANKEMAVGLLNGIAWSMVVAVATFAWFQDPHLAIIIAAAMLLNLIAAAISGVAIPVILKRMGIDPALSGAVVLTTVTDIVGFLSFLGLATIYLL